MITNQENAKKLKRLHQTVYPNRTPKSPDRKSGAPNRFRFGGETLPPKPNRTVPTPTYKRNKRARSILLPNKLTSPIVLIQPPPNFPKDLMDFQPDILKKPNNLVLLGTPEYY